MRFYHLSYGDMRNGQEGDLFPIDELLGPLMYHAGGSRVKYGGPWARQTIANSVSGLYLGFRYVGQTDHGPGSLDGLARLIYMGCICHLGLG